MRGRFRVGARGGGGGAGAGAGADGGDEGAGFSHFGIFVDGSGGAQFYGVFVVV